MRNFFIMVALTMLMVSCNAQTKSGDGFNINGSWSGGKDGDTVFCVAITQLGVIPTDTAFVKGGKFKMTVNEKEAALRTVVAVRNGMPASAAEIIVTPKGSVNVELSNSNNEMGKVSGNRDSEIWVAARKAAQDREQQLLNNAQDLIRTVNDSTLDIVTRFVAQKQIDSLSQSVYDVYADAILNNMPSPTCGLMLRYFGDNIDPKRVNQIVEQMGKKMPDDPVYKALTAQRNVEQETAVGKPYKEIAMVDLKGNMKRLSDVVKSNKLTLIDFWASWCAPCRAEMPNVKKLYAAYHDKGLEIYGVSFDENMVNWQNAVSQMRLPWIQVSDLKGWASDGAKIYNIRAIPATILIDGNGTIIGKNLRGNDLAKKVAEILDK